MQVCGKYVSPIGDIVLCADNQGLTGLWFDDKDKEAKQGQADKSCSDAAKFLEEAKAWLDIYFDGGVPNFTPKLHLIGTDFRIEVWNRLLEIPYGKTVSYGEIAKELASKRGIERMAAQAVGGAVGHNDISIIVPCHRVIGSDGKLTGYGGGLDKKVFLLELEKGQISK